MKRFMVILIFCLTIVSVPAQEGKAFNNVYTLLN